MAEFDSNLFNKIYIKIELIMFLMTVMVIG